MVQILLADGSRAMAGGYSPSAAQDIATKNYVDTTSGGGNVSNTGTPVNNQVAIWTNSTTIEGDTDLTFNGTTLTVGNTIALSSTSLDLNSVPIEDCDYLDLFDVGIPATPASTHARIYLDNTEATDTIDVIWDDGTTDTMVTRTP